MKNIKDDTLGFSIVINEIQTFLEPVFEAIVNEDEWNRRWDSGLTKWLNLKEGKKTNCH